MALRLVDGDSPTEPPLTDVEGAAKIAEALAEIGGRMPHGSRWRGLALRSAGRWKGAALSARAQETLRGPEAS